jgi:phage tail sheath protein FI
MATYIKPGVYIEENVAAVRTLNNSTPSSAAVFIGVADHGPTKLDGTTVLAVPTLVTSWTDFNNKFGFASTVDPFKTTVNTNSYNLKYAVKSFFDNGGGQAYVMRLVNTNAAAATTTFGTSLKVDAVDPGAWGNRLWTEVVVNANSTFDLYVYYNDSVTATSGAVTYAANTLETYSQLSMSTSSTRYAPSIVKSNYIKLTGLSTTNPSAAKQQLSGGTFGSTAPTLATHVFSQLDAIQGPLVVNWPRNNSYGTPIAVTNREATTSVSTLTVASGHGVVVGDSVYVDSVDNTFNGNYVVTATSATTVAYAVTRASSVTSTASTGVIGVYGKAYSTVANASFTYADTREDVFVVVDSPVLSLGSSTDTTATTILGTLNTLNSSKNLGAAYYPYITVVDPTSRSGATVSIAPGGAVTAMYLNADQQKGAFQSPAGVGARINDAVSVPALTSSEFTEVSNNAVALNVIRYVPGSGICVMGARTMSSAFKDRYVSVRRSLQYINQSLVNQTAYAVFEPNDAVLWSRVRSTIDNFLYRYWKQGGLKGDTPSQAYYIKCDSDINTQSAIENGELRIEVGVALQTPAEFVIIRIGQLDGGSSVSVSI